MFVFFDIDGTLLDQRHAERAGAAALLSEYRHLLPQSCDVAWFCRRWRELRDLHLPSYLSGAISYLEYRRRRVRDLFPDGSGLPPQELDARDQVFHRNYRQAWRPFEDVHPTLDRLQTHFPLGILSNGNTAHQLWKLRSMGILERFQVVVISDEIGVGKPRQAIFLEACRRAGVPASRCVCVGDRVDHDVHPSVASGMRGVWLNRGPEQAGLNQPGANQSGFSPSELNQSEQPQASHSVETIRSLAELPSRLESDWELGTKSHRGDLEPAVPQKSAGGEMYSG